jgi:hypothetical protein
VPADKRVLPLIQLNAVPSLTLQESHDARREPNMNTQSSQGDFRGGFHEAYFWLQMAELVILTIILIALAVTHVW